MKLIFKIARTELRNLFYSPVAWFLAIVFLVQCAIFYTGSVETTARWHDMIARNNPKFQGGDMLTANIFLGQGGIFVSVITNLYLFLPLLTMGMVSKEINNGTIKLLYAAPIKTKHIVLGKYLSLLLYNLVLMGIMGIFIVAGVLNIKNVDMGLLLSASLGFYLLICAFSAIGLFMSSLSTYQIVSAIATFMVIFVLSSISKLWQQYDFVRDLTYFLSLNGRTQRMLKGLITTNDVIYFLIVSWIFLSFTLFRLKGARESSPWYKKAIRYIGVILIALTVGYMSARPGWVGYWDTTNNDANTIHPKTQQLLAAFDKKEPLEITLYGNLLGSGFAIGGKPETRNNYIWNFWDPYIRFKPDIKFNYVNYYDVKDGDSSYYKNFPNKNLEQIAKEMASTMDVDFSRLKTPGEIRKIINLQPENVRLVMHLKYKGKSIFLRTYNDRTFWPYESHIAAALKRLLIPDIPKVLFTSGNLERSIYKTGEREYFLMALNKEARYALINHGFEPDTISLDTKEIPSNISSLVVADPKTTLSDVKQQKIRKFIQDGGNVMFLTEPGKQQMLNPLLSEFGAHLGPGIVVQLTADEMPQVIKPYFTPFVAFLAEKDTSPAMLRQLSDFYENDTIRMSMPGSVEITQEENKGMKMNPILVTDKGTAYNKMGVLVSDSTQPVFSPQEGDYRKDSFVVLAGFTRDHRPKQQRILISGDADFFCTQRGGALGLNVNYFSWLDNNRFPITTPGKPSADRRLKLSFAVAKSQSVFLVWILPALLLLLGSVILIRRKRK